MIPTYEYIQLSKLIKDKGYIMEPTVKKSWGYEIWFENNEKYCGKLLFVKYGEWSSKGKFHFHKNKDETFFVIEGTLIIEYEKDNKIHQSKFSEFGTIRILPGVKHRFTSFSKEGCKFIEVSTTHEDSDSYRCEWNEEKGEWTE